MNSLAILSTHDLDQLKFQIFRIKTINLLVCIGGPGQEGRHDGENARIPSKAILKELVFGRFSVNAMLNTPTAFR